MGNGITNCYPDEVGKFISITVLKKKFVVETQYCITVGIIPEDFYDEIVLNEAQRKEWIKLYAIDELRGDLTTPAILLSSAPSF